MKRATKKETVWVNDTYAAFPTYENVAGLRDVLNGAYAVEQSGRWREIHLELSEDYDGFTAVLVGQRHEKPGERKIRLMQADHRKSLERAEFERLRRIYGEKK